MNRLVLVGALLSAPFVTAGCSIFIHRDAVSPKANLDGRRVLVAPLSEPGQSRFESEIGIEIARAVVSRLLEDAGAVQVLGPGNLAEAYRWKTPADLPLLDAARALGADRAVVADLVTFRTRDPKDVGLVRGTAIADVRLVDTTAGDAVLLQEKVTVNYPDDVETSVEFGREFETDEAEVRKALVQRIAVEIARLFYGKRGDRKRS